MRFRCPGAGRCCSMLVNAGPNGCWWYFTFLSDGWRWCRFIRPMPVTHSVSGIETSTRDEKGSSGSPSSFICGLILYLLRILIHFFPGSGTHKRLLPDEERGGQKTICNLFFSMRKHENMYARNMCAVAGRTKTTGWHTNDYFITALKYNMLVMLFMAEGFSSSAMRSPQRMVGVL